MTDLSQPEKQADIAQRSAIVRSEQWLRRRLEREKCETWSQYAQVMKSVARQGTENILGGEQLEQELSVAAELVDDIRKAFIPPGQALDTEWRVKGKIWQRRDVLPASDPKRYFTELQSGKFIEVSRGDVQDVAGRLLNHDWLKCSFLEWAIVDALITTEINAFGTESGVGGHAFLFKRSWLQQLLGKSAISERDSLWRKMARVHRLLDGALLNPTMIRAELLATREAGAIWDNAVYSVVDHVIARNPVVWAIEY